MTQPPVPQPRIPLREAAERLGVSRQSLRRWAHAGKITYFLVGEGHYMEFDPRDVDAYERSWRREREAPPVT